MTVEEKYDELLERVSNLLKNKNVCGFDENNICFVHRQAKNKGKEYSAYNCCRGDGRFGYKENYNTTHCDALTPGVGCSAKSLMCSLWFCPEATDKLDNETYEELTAIDMEAKLYDLKGFLRASKEDMMNKFGKDTNVEAIKDGTLYKIYKIHKNFIKEVS